MTKNITKMLNERQTTGKKLKLYKQVLPNREAANVMHNRKVHTELVEANQRKRESRQRANRRAEMYVNAQARFLTNPAPTMAERDYVHHLRDQSNAATTSHMEVRRYYDKVVENVADVLQKQRTWREHYHANVVYREGNLALQYPTRL